MAKADEDGEPEVTFFDGKLQLHRRSCFSTEGEVLVVPCVPDLLSGGEMFKNVIGSAGSALTTALRPFLCLEAGSCKMTSAYELKNYKKLAMCVLPELFADETLSHLDQVKIWMCIADALDLSAEASATSVYFTDWPIASIADSAEILLLCISYWFRTSVYASKLTNISVFIEHPDEFDAYCQVAKMLDEDRSLVLPVLKQRRPDEYPMDGMTEAEMAENYPMEYGGTNRPPGRSAWNNVRSMHDRRLGLPNNPNGNSPFLFYSRNLSTSILSIEQPDGSIHQYRLSTTVHEKNTHYFRCSRCDYLTRMHSGSGQFRPKITVRDGQIVSERFPAHHPMCQGMSKTTFVVQQLDRLWKAIARYETDDLRRCYVSLRNIAQKEADSLYNEMENPQGKFPEWEMLRQSAEKYPDHNQYSMRLIKCATDVTQFGGISLDQYSQIRRVEGELDGTAESGYAAWLTEGVELEREEAPEEEVAAEATTSGVNTRSNQSVMTKRVVSVKSRTETHVVVEETKSELDSPTKRPQRTIKPTYKLRSSDDPSSPLTQSTFESRPSPTKRSRN